MRAVENHHLDKPSPTGAVSEDRPAAIIVGIDSMQGLQTARILKGHGIPVYGVSREPKHHTLYTNTCKQLVIAETEERLIAALEELGPTLSGKGVLIPCTDGFVKNVSRSRDRFSPWYHVVLPPHDVLEMLMNKDSFGKFGEIHAIPIPITRNVSNRSEFERAVTDVGCPAVIKPPFRNEGWSANTVEKGFLAESEAELRTLYDRCSTWVEHLVIQQWIRGDTSELFSCNVYYTREGEPVASFVARKLRQWPLDTGQSSLGEECRLDGVHDLTLKLFDAVPYQGLGYVEIKRDFEDGNLYVIEANIGRPTGRSAIAEGGGVELLYTLYCDGVGLPLPEARKQSFSGVKWIHLRRDLQSAIQHWRRGELTIAEWWRSVRGPKVFALFSLRDPLPFLRDLWDAARVAVRGRGLS